MRKSFPIFTRRWKRRPRTVLQLPLLKNRVLHRERNLQTIFYTIIPNIPLANEYSEKQLLSDVCKLLQLFLHDPQQTTALTFDIYQ